MVIKSLQDVTEPINAMLSDDAEDAWLTGPLVELCIAHKIQTVHPLDCPKGTGLKAMDERGRRERVLLRHFILVQNHHQ